MCRLMPHFLVMISAKARIRRANLLKLVFFCLYRRKYDIQQFLNSAECMIYPFPRPISSSNYRSPSGKNLVLALDKKHIDKQVSTLRISGIGHVFRNSCSSWKRRDEIRNSKRGDLTVNIYISCIINVLSHI